MSHLQFYRVSLSRNFIAIRTALYSVQLCRDKALPVNLLLLTYTNTFSCGESDVNCPRVKLSWSLLPYLLWWDIHENYFTVCSVEQLKALTIIVLSILSQKPIIIINCNACYVRFISAI